MPVWDDFLTPLDREVFEAAGYTLKGDLGDRPAVLVVDIVYNFVGEEPEPILESIKKYHHSCGERGWEGVYATRELLEAARGRNVPIFYSTNATRPDGSDLGRWSAKNQRALPHSREARVVQSGSKRPHSIEAKEEIQGSPKRYRATSKDHSLGESSYGNPRTLQDF